MCTTGVSFEYAVKLSDLDVTDEWSTKYRSGICFCICFGMFESMVSAIVLVCNITREGVGLVRLHHNNHCGLVRYMFLGIFLWNV